MIIFHQGRTVLHYAVWLNSQKATRLISERDPSMILHRADGWGGRTPLHVAIMYSSNEVFDTLLDTLPEASFIDIPDEVSTLCRRSYSKRT